MHTHAHAYLAAVGPGVSLECALPFRHSLKRPTPAREGDEERIALRIHLHTAPGSERGAQQAPMIGQHSCVAVTQLVQQPVEGRTSEGRASTRGYARAWLRSKTEQFLSSRSGRRCPLVPELAHPSCTRPATETHLSAAPERAATSASREPTSDEVSLNPGRGGLACGTATDLSASGRPVPSSLRGSAERHADATRTSRCSG
jgi:hypothetical protein